MTQRFFSRVAGALLIAALFGSSPGHAQEEGPRGPEPFYGRWIGIWQSRVAPALALSGKGTLEEVIIVPDPANSPNHVAFTAWVTSPLFPSVKWQTNPVSLEVSAVGIFRDGEVVFETAMGTRFTFRLTEENRIEATYYDPRSQDRGTWQLSRAGPPPDSPSFWRDTAQQCYDEVTRGRTFVYHGRVGLVGRAGCDQYVQDMEAREVREKALLPPLEVTPLERRPLTPAPR